MRVGLTFWAAVLSGLCFAAAAWAEVLPVALRAIPARAVIAAGDVGPEAGTAAAEALIGQEALRLIPRGQQIRPEDVGPRTLVERNQLVALIFSHGGLRIETAGRALDRGAAGALVRVMNLGSRQTVTGRVTPEGAVAVPATF
jgi:flagella basal body P-ring formation protein FlgA